MALSGKRFVAELRLGTERSAVNVYGARCIYDYTYLLEPLAGRLLLPPQWSPTEGRVSWSWQQAEGAAPPSADELQVVRQELRSLADSLPAPATADLGRQVAGRGLDDRQTKSLVLQKGREIMLGLAALDDRALAGFVCRTREGCRIHSWGAITPARPRIPGVTGYPVRGRVVASGVGMPRGRMHLEDSQGQRVLSADIQSDGSFAFEHIVPGSYQVIPELENADPERGAVSAVVSRGPVEGLSFPARLHAPPAPPSIQQTPIPQPDPMPEPESFQKENVPKRRRRWLWLAFAGLLLILLAVWFAYERWFSARRPAGLLDYDLPGGEWPLVMDEGRTRPLGFGEGVAGLSTTAAATQPMTAQSNNDDQAVTADSVSRGPEQNQSMLDGNEGGGAQPAEGRQGNGQKAENNADSNTPPSTPPLGPGQEGENGGAGNAQRTGATQGTGPGTTTQDGGAAQQGARGQGNPQGGGDDFRGNTVPSSPPLNGAQGGGNNGRGLEQGLGSNQGRGPGATEQGGSVPRQNESLQPGAPEGTGESGSNSLPSTAPLGGNQSGNTRAAGGEVGLGENKNPGPGLPNSEGGAPQEGDAKQVNRQDSGDPLGNDTKPTTPPSGGEKNGEDNGDSGAQGPGPIQGTGPRAAALGSDNAQQGERRPDRARELAQGVQSPQQQSVSNTGWQLKSLRDQVIPTAIVREGEDDGMERKRAEMIAEGRLRTPRSFSNPRTQGGFALTFPEQGPGAPVWRNVNGTGVPGSTATGNRAELNWPDGKPVPGVYTLDTPAGQRLAEVTVQDNGEATLRTEAGTQGWYWVGVERDPADDSQLTPAQWGERLQWRLLDREGLPSQWRQDNTWRGGRGYRLDMPVSTSGEARSFPLALVDQWTGKALVHEHQRKP